MWGSDSPMSGAGRNLKKNIRTVIRIGRNVDHPGDHLKIVRVGFGSYEIFPTFSS